MSLERWEAVKARVVDLGRAHLRVGVVGQEAAEIHLGSGLTNGELALIHELGNPRTGLPARSFVRRTLENPRVRAELARMQAMLVGQAIEGRISRDEALTQIGEYLAGEIRKTILEDQVRPELAPATVAAKGSEVPLLETHQLVEAVGFEIVA